MSGQTFPRRFLASSAGLSVATLVASVLGVGLNLVIPFVLPAAEYARYSLMLGFAQLIASVLFEWVRVNVIRFSNTADLEADANRRAVLTWVYAVTIGVMTLAAVVSLLLVGVSLWFWSSAIVVATAALQGIFDGQQAASRAALDNTSVSLRILLRTSLAFACSVAAGLMFRTGDAALLGFALAFPLTSLIGVRALPTALGKAHFSLPVFLRMLNFGMLAAAGTNLSLAIPAAIRSVVVASVGLAQAGGILLVIDLSQRVFATIGMSVNIVAVQNAIRAIEFGDDRQIREKIRQQIMAVACLILPIIIVFAFIQQPLADYIIPTQYHDGFEAGGLAAVIAIGIMAIRQYSLDPLFVVLGKAVAAPVGTATMLVVLLAFELLVPADWLGGSVQATMSELIFASIAGLVVTAVALMFTKTLPWPIRDMIWVGAATIITILVGMVLPPAHGIWAGIAVATVLGLVFVAAIIIGNVLETRALLRLAGRPWRRG